VAETCVQEGGSQVGPASVSDVWAVDGEGSAGAGSLGDCSSGVAETEPADGASSSSSSGGGGCLAKAAAAAAVGVPGPDAGSSEELQQQQQLQQNSMLLATYGYGIPGGYDVTYSNPLAEGDGGCDWPVREVRGSSSRRSCGNSSSSSNARRRRDELQGLLDMETVKKVGAKYFTLLDAITFGFTHAHCVCCKTEQLVPAPGRRP
jgi:hypothetical protein